MSKEKNTQNDSNSNSPLGVGGVLGGGCKNSMFYGALPIHFELAKKLRNNQTEAELYLWDNLQRLTYLNIRFKRQHPVLYFIADFYCHSCKLVIELDGKIHDQQKEYDEGRSAEIEKWGITVIRFTNDEVFKDLDAVVEKIKGYLSLATSSLAK